MAPFEIIINSIFIVSSVFLLITAVSHTRHHDKDNYISIVLRHMLIAAAALSITYYVAIYVPNETLSHVIFCISHMFFDFVILQFFIFSILYTENMRFSNLQIRIAESMVFIDIVNLGVGIFAKQAIRVVQIQSGSRYIYSYVPEAFYLLHYIIGISLVAYALVKLFLAAYKAPYSYRRRYSRVAMSVIVVIIVNIAYHAFGKDMLDMSELILPFAVVVIYYFSMLHSPNQLVLESRDAIIGDMDDGIVILDYNHNFKNSNKAALDILNVGEKKIQEVLDSWLALNNIDVSKEGQYSFSDATDPKRKVLRVTCKVYIEKKTPDRITGTYIRIHDCTEDIKRQQEQVYASTHDGLTGLLNRDAFLDGVNREIADCTDIDHYLVCSNIENFKLYNDLFGTEEGDRLLKNIGKALKRHIGDAIIIGRMDADRFSVLIKKKDFNEESFKQVYAEALWDSDKLYYSVNAYIGVYEVQNRNETAGDMYNRVLMAAQTIKGMPDKFVAFYDSSVTDSTLKEQELIDELRKALYDEEFEFFLQPQVTPAGQVLGGEALVRWRHPQKGIVSPFFFISAMERHGMIADLDLLVWTKVARKLAEWKKRGVDKYISVNISTKDFFYMDIYKVFTELVASHDIDISKLKLEITESAIMQNEGEQLALISKLRETGFSVEMDDFGSGYSSLNMLNKMNVDVLKLDMGFLKTDADEQKSYIILKNIQSMAKELNMITVAEGVETKEQAEYLTSIGCDIFQGYYYSPPVPVDEFEEKYILS